MLFGVSYGEIAVIALVLALLFGASRLPALGRALGQTIRAAKDGLSGDERRPKP